MVSLQTRRDLPRAHPRGFEFFILQNVGNREHADDTKFRYNQDQLVRNKT